VSALQHDRAAGQRRTGEAARSEALRVRRANDMRAHGGVTKSDRLSVEHASPEREGLRRAKDRRQALAPPSGIPDLLYHIGRLSVTRERKCSAATYTPSAARVMRRSRTR